MKKIFLLIILLIFIFGCTQQQKNLEKREPITVQIGSPQRQPQIIQQEPPQSPVNKPIVRTVKEFTVEMKQFSFSPSTIVVNNGDKVKLKITAVDVTHGFSLPDFGVETGPVAPGTTVTKEFTADKSGTFKFECSVYCGSGHPEMEGTLIVNMEG